MTRENSPWGLGSEYVHTTTIKGLEGRTCHYDADDDVWVYDADTTKGVVCALDHPPLNLEGPGTLSTDEQVAVPTRTLGEWIELLRQESQVPQIMYVLGQMLEAWDHGKIMPDALTPEQFEEIQALLGPNARKTVPEPREGLEGPQIETSQASDPSVMQRNVLNCGRSAPHPAHRWSRTLPQGNGITTGEVTFWYSCPGRKAHSKTMIGRQG